MPWEDDFKFGNRKSRWSTIQRTLDEEPSEAYSRSFLAYLLLQCSDDFSDFRQMAADALARQLRQSHVDSRPARNVEKVPRREDFPSPILTILATI
jgi:hypothetical protein